MNNKKSGSIKKKILLIAALTAASGVIGVILLMHAAILGSIVFADTAGADFKKAFENETGVYFRKIGDEMNAIRLKGDYAFGIKLNSDGIIVNNSDGNTVEKTFSDWNDVKQNLQINKESHIGYVMADDEKVLFDFHGEYAIVYTLNAEKQVLPAGKIQRTVKLADGWYYYKMQ